MFTKVAVFSLLASIVAANAVPYAEHANLAVREAEPTTTSTEIVYVTITQTIPYPNANAKETNAVLIGGTHNGTHSGNGTEGGSNGTKTGVDGPEITDPSDNGAAGLRASHVMGMMGLVGAFAFLL